jgi:hypothetical protein
MYFPQSDNQLRIATTFSAPPKFSPLLAVVANGSRAKKVEVVVPPPGVGAFEDMNDTEDEYEPTPPPPSQPKRSKSHSGHLTCLIEVFAKACEWCQKGDRDCVVEELGAACVGCKFHKYKCNRTGLRNALTMKVVQPAPASEDLEVEVVEDKKGKKWEVVELRKGKKGEEVEVDRKGKR